MPSLIYSPGIRVFISTQSHGVIEVSEDISQGSIRLALGRDDGHQVNLTLTNQGRKYDGIFTPNDRIVVFLKRIRWLQTFSGYLDSVPRFSAYARAIQLSGSCTLKRLKYALYDQGSSEFAALMNANAQISGASSSLDSNLALKIVDVVTKMGGWDASKVHIGAIPPDWFQGVAALYDRVKPELSLDPMTGVQIGGTSPLSDGVTSYPNTNIPGTGYLPANSGRVGAIGDIGDPISNQFDLTNERTDNAIDQWYCGMRWPYRTEASDDPASVGMTIEQKYAAMKWWREQRIMVMNPQNLKTIIVRPAFYGPSAASGRALDLSTTGLEELGLKSGDFAQFAFAPVVASSSQGVLLAPVGPYVQKSRTPANATGITSTLNELNQAATGNASSANAAEYALGETGVVFAERDQLKANVAAAQDFIRSVWPSVTGIGGWRASGSTPTSDHPRGLALDVSIGNGDTTEPNVDQVALGNSVAFWFTQNPLVFGSAYVIFNNMYYSATGAVPYHHPDDLDGNDLSLSHRNHVHISFLDTGQVSMGASGSPWPVVMTDFMRTAARDGVVHQDRASSITLPSTTGATAGQVITTTWTQVGQELSTWLTGPRQLLNDVPLRPLVDQLVTASQRDYCAAPNGDLIAWWPDYYNLYGTCARLVLQSIELDGFNVQWNDKNMVTHQFVTGSTGLGSFAGNANVGVDEQFIIRQLYTHGIASIDFPEILKAVLNIEPDSAWANPSAIYARFGARVNAASVGWIASPEVEFWYAINRFRQSWGSQFSTSPEIGFMPELFPGMILQIPDYGVQFYVDQVTHTFSLGESGSGFSTQVAAMAPSTIGRHASLTGLPVGGSQIGNEGGAGPPQPGR